MIPIFMPSPAVASVGPQTVGAPISCGVRLSSAWYVTLGQTVAPGIAAQRRELRGAERRRRSRSATTP